MDTKKSLKLSKLDYNIKNLFRMPFINVIPNNSEESESIHQMLADSSLCSNPTVTPLEIITIHLFYV